MREIQERYPEAYRRAEDEAKGEELNYNGLMEQVSPNGRQELLNGFVEKAKINWAHLALAQLFLKEKIDRVLTVNFDPLLVKACAMVNFFPAIYDLASASHFKSHRIAPRSLFYLNGQHTGFVMLNAEDELEAHRHKLRTVVQDTGVKRLWLVVGYSGEADPLLDVLCEQACFDGDLYWLGHGAEPSARLIDSGLFNRGRHAFFVGGQDADACLTELAQKSQCFPPELLVKPFEHLRSVIQNINFETGGDAAGSIVRRLNEQLDAAASKEDEPTQRSLNQAEQWMLSGEYDLVLNWFAQLAAPVNPAKELAAWAHVMQGIALANEAQALQSQDLPGARALWAKAGEKYAQALSIKADKHEAAKNWGSVLIREAGRLSPEEGVPDRTAEAHSLLTRAEILLLRHSQMDLLGRNLVAYNLACAFSMQAKTEQAVEQLEICIGAGNLPTHWREDEDLAPIRNTPAYRGWLAKHSLDDPTSKP